jgi:hypothetical protein
MPTVVFHVTSTHNRASILRHGLDWTRMGDQPGIAGSGHAERDCVFLARDIEEAEWFVSISRSHHQSVDIWEITLPHDFDLYDDVVPGPAYGEVDGFLFTTERIPRERIRLLRTDA